LHRNRGELRNYNAAEEKEKSLWKVGESNLQPDISPLLALRLANDSASLRTCSGTEPSVTESREDQD
jgi:hypothetical protein